MGYAAVMVTILGIVIGAAFRLQILLAFVVLLLVVSVVASFWSGFDFIETAETMLVGQITLQSSYFLGLVVNSAYSRGHRAKQVI